MFDVAGMTDLQHFWARTVLGYYAMKIVYVCVVCVCVFLCVWRVLCVECCEFVLCVCVYVVAWCVCGMGCV